MQIDLTEIDHAALKLAVDLTLADPDQDRVEQMQKMMEQDPWWEYATFASYYQQTRNLHLKPWQDPPSAVLDDDKNDPDAVRLLNRMLKRGISRFHPDPMAALRESRRRLR